MRTENCAENESLSLVNELGDVLLTAAPMYRSISVWIGTTYERKGCAVDFSTTIEVKYSCSFSVLLNRKERIIKPMNRQEAAKIQLSKTREVTKSIPLLCNTLGIGLAVYADGKSII